MNINNQELDTIQIQLLQKHTSYLMKEYMTYENRYEYYENFGMVITILNDTSFNTSDISHTHKNDLDDLVGAKNELEFQETLYSHIPTLIQSQIVDVQGFVNEQKALYSF